MKHKLLIFLAAVTVALVPLLFQDGASSAQSDTTFDSPFPTPPAPPIPIPPRENTARSMSASPETAWCPPHFRSR